LCALKIEKKEKNEGKKLTLAKPLRSKATLEGGLRSVPQNPDPDDEKKKSKGTEPEGKTQAKEGKGEC